MLSNAGTNGNHDTPQTVAAALRQSFAARFPIPLWGPDLVVGVSGGPDSVALAHLATTLNREAGGPSRICLAHVNHGLRGSESDGDQEFVRNLADQFGAEFHSWRVSAPTENRGEGPENRLRDIRYGLLAGLARERSSRCIALAHHRDDQVETILFRIFRGTSLKGLQGIPPARELETGISLVRPLIDISRQQILDYLAGQGLPHRTDSTNLHDGPTRNWIRNELLPQLAERFGRAVSKNIEGLGQHAEEMQQIIDDLSAQLMERSISVIRPELVELESAPLKSTSTPLLQQMLVRLWTIQSWPQRDMTREKWQKLAQLIQLNDTTACRMELPGRITFTALSNGKVRLQSGDDHPAADSP